MKCKKADCENCPYPDCIWEPRTYKRTREETLKALERQKRARVKWAAAGLCTKCGGKRTDKRYRTCLSCRMKSQAYQEKFWRKKGRNPRTEGICWQCNKAPVMPGYGMCESCYAAKIPVSMKNLEKAWANNLWEKDISYIAKNPRKRNGKQSGQV